MRRGQSLALLVASSAACGSPTAPAGGPASAPGTGSAAAAPGAPPLSSTGPSASASAAPAPASAPLFGRVRGVLVKGANLCALGDDGGVRCVGEWPLNFETETSSGGRNQYIHAPIAVRDLTGATSVALASSRGAGFGNAA